MSQVTLFTDILPEEQERMRVCFQAREVSFHNHEIIFAYSNTMNKIGLILSGRAVLYYCDEEGNQYMIDELKKDAVFGEPFLLPVDSRNYYVQAEEETRVMFIDYAHVIKRCENACWHHSQLVSNLLQMIALQSRQQVQRIYVLSEPLPGRSFWPIWKVFLRSCTAGRSGFPCPIRSWPSISAWTEAP